MNVARRIGYVKAQKYDRFSVTELYGEGAGTDLNQ